MVLRLTAVLLLSLMLPAQKKIVILAGSKDSHPAGTHEYRKAADLLRHGLLHAGLSEAFTVEVHDGGWPTDEATLEDAATIVVISAGADQRREDHPLLVAGRFETLRRQMARGCGLVAVHWSVFVPRAPEGDAWLRFVGGHFDYESGPPPRRWASAITTGDVTLRPATPSHPILRGVSETTQREEIYHGLRFLENDPRRTPILRATIEGVASEQEVAWTVEREDGGRGFGYTGGHFLTNWLDPSIARMLMNAVLWSAKLPVPRTGASLAEVRPIRVLVLSGHHHPAHDSRATTEALREGFERDARLRIVVSEDPERALSTELNDFDVVVQNYCNWERPGLSTKAKETFVRWVEAGGGLMILHFANGAWHRSLPGAEDSHFDAYHERLVRRSWDHRDPAVGHDPYGPFHVTVKPVDHPITRGISSFETLDELYFGQAGKQPVEALLTARSQATKREEPMAFAYEVSKGRVFQTVLGHAAESLRVPEVSLLLQRAAAWTAGKEPLLTAPTRPHDGVGEGRFGGGLDARKRTAALEANAAYGEMPLTVSCWTRLFSADQFNVLVSNELKTSRTHWELYSYAKTGCLSAYFPGSYPAEVQSSVRITDGEWHHVGMSCDGRNVVLWVDGKVVHRSLQRPQDGMTSVTSPLFLGLARHPGYKVGCDGLLDDVLVRRGIHELPQPSGPPNVTADTLALFTFDASSRPFADAAKPAREDGWVPSPDWTPRGSTGTDLLPWEREGEDDWMDDRFQRMDCGPTFAASFRLKDVAAAGFLPRGMAITMSSPSGGVALYDTALLRVAGLWDYGRVRPTAVRFGLVQAAEIAGTPRVALPELAGWSATPDFRDQRSDPHGPFPETLARFEGHYLYGSTVVLRLTVHGVSILEQMAKSQRGANVTFTRTLELAPHQNDLFTLVAPGAQWTLSADGHRATRAEDDQVVVLVGPGRLTISEDGNLAANLTAAESGTTVHLHYGEPPESSATPSLASLTRGGDARWTTLVTHGTLGKKDGPYVVDDLAPPFENPYGALLFLSGVDNLLDGRLVVCAAHGDVWIVEPTEDLSEVRWTRFATGLYQPLGVKVVDGKILVLGRDRITRLHDLDGDDEADFYESFCDLLSVNGTDHAYAMSLERDPRGWLYFQKSGDRETTHGGSLVRVSPDGRSMEIVATGFRHTNGLCVGPRGEITNADNEGNWVPATRLNWIRPGGFYGYEPARRGVADPAPFDPPLCWLPRRADNSAGGQVWVTSDAWGPLSDQLLHLSYGRATLNLVLTEEVSNVRQGGIVRLPLTFNSGIMRGHFHPEDGQLYVCGLDGWLTAARDDGCLQRVRYVGGAVRQPKAVKALEDRLLLEFHEGVDPASVTTEAFSLKRWQYRYTAAYGSEHYSLTDPSQLGEDKVAISRVTSSEDGKLLSVFVEMRVAQQVELQWTLRARDGTPVQGTYFGTVHNLTPSR